MRNARPDDVVCRRMVPIVAPSRLLKDYHPPGFGVTPILPREQYPALHAMFCAEARRARGSWVPQPLRAARPGGDQASRGASGILFVLFDTVAPPHATGSRSLLCRQGRMGCAGHRNIGGAYDADVDPQAERAQGAASQYHDDRPAPCLRMRVRRDRVGSCSVEGAVTDGHRFRPVVIPGSHPASARAVA